MKKLALITDVRNWAFHNIASHIECFLGDDYEIRILFTEDYDEQDFGLYNDAYLEFKADHVHYFWREQYFSLWRNPAGTQRRMLASGVDINDFATAFGRAINTTTVYDHMFGDAEALAERKPMFELLDGYSVASPILERLYGDNTSTAPCGVTEDGIDLSLFYPDALDRFEETDRPLIVGWTGNSEWGKNQFTDMKGVHTIINPAVAILKNEGLSIDSDFADRNDKWRSREEMREYYASIDVLVCASEFEGTPNPVLEAMACGVPVISTRVGIVEMALTGPQTPFILKERSAEALADALRILVSKRELLKTLSSHNLEAIQTWTWAQKMDKWRALFDASEAAHTGRDEARGFLLARVLNDARDLDRLRNRIKKLSASLNNRTSSGELQGTSGQIVAARLETAENELASAGRRIENLLDALNKNRSARINYQKQVEKLTETLSDVQPLKRSA